MNYHSRMPIEPINAATVEKVVEYFNDLFKNKEVNFTEPTAANFNDYATAPELSLDERVLTFKLTDKDVIRKLYGQYLCAMDLGVNQEGFGTGPYGKYFECITGLYISTDPTSNEQYIVVTLSEINGYKIEVSEVQDQLNPIITYCKKRFDIDLNIKEVLVDDYDGKTLRCVRAEGFEDKGPVASPPSEQAGGQLPNQTPSKTKKVSEILYDGSGIDNAVTGFLNFFADPKPTEETLKGIVFDGADATGLVFSTNKVNTGENQESIAFPKSDLTTLIKTAFIVYLLSIEGTDYSYLVPCIKCIYQDDNNYYLTVQYDPVNDSQPLNNKQLLERLLYFNKKYNVSYAVSGNNTGDLFFMTQEHGVQIFNPTGLHIDKSGVASTINIKTGLPWATTDGNSYEEILKVYKPTPITEAPSNLSNPIVSADSTTGKQAVEGVQGSSEKGKALNRLNQANIKPYVDNNTPLENIENVQLMAAIVLGKPNINNIKNDQELYNSVYRPEYDRIKSLSDIDFAKEFGDKYNREDIDTIVGYAYAILLKKLRPADNGNAKGAEGKAEGKEEGAGAEGKEEGAGAEGKEEGAGAEGKEEGEGKAEADKQAELLGGTTQFPTSFKNLNEHVAKRAQTANNNSTKRNKNTLRVSLANKSKQITGRRSRRS